MAALWVFDNSQAGLTQQMNRQDAYEPCSLAMLAKPPWIGKGIFGKNSEQSVNASSATPMVTPQPKDRLCSTPEIASR
jgi:hypothetical protein